MPQPLGQFPRSLLAHALWRRIDGIPTVFMHPAMKADPPSGAHLASDAPRLPTVLWLHGRTVNKELDPGRYQRLLAAGMAVIAMDLPGHGERADPALQQPGSLAALIDAALPEIDRLASWCTTQPGIDSARLAIGGMSAGAMIAACRLCSAHPFTGLLMESSTGDLLTLPRAADRGGGRLAALNPIDRLVDWREIPVLALHSELDSVVPIGSQRRFIDALRRRATTLRERITLHSWPATAAPNEHAGFGRVAADAKLLGTQFLQRVSGLTPW